jgi:hypothetical protein
LTAGKKDRRLHNTTGWHQSNRKNNFDSPEEEEAKKTHRRRRRLLQDSSSFVLRDDFDSTPQLSPSRDSASPWPLLDLTQCRQEPGIFDAQDPKPSGIDPKAPYDR